MKIKTLYHFLRISLVVLLFTCWHPSAAQESPVFKAPVFVPDTSTSEQVKKMDEGKLKFSKAILHEEFDFELSPSSQGKFTLNILQDTKAMVSIKVYDIIGNLLYEEKVRVRGSFSKEFDLSQLNTRLFIVEIGNETFNKTKSVVAS